MTIKMEKNTGVSGKVDLLGLSRASSSIAETETRAMNSVYLASDTMTKSTDIVEKFQMSM